MKQSEHGRPTYASTWAVLKTPETTFAAQGTAVVSLAGSYLLHFGQIAPSGKLMVVLVIVVPLRLLRAGLTHLADVIEALPSRIQVLLAAGAGGALDLPLDQVGAEAKQTYTQVAAQFFRVACSEDTAVMDFYEEPVQVKGMKETRGLLPKPAVRVAMSPITLQRLLQQLESHNHPDAIKNTDN